MPVHLIKDVEFLFTVMFCQVLYLSQFVIFRNITGLQKGRVTFFSKNSPLDLVNSGFVFVIMTALEVHVFNEQSLLVLKIACIAFGPTVK